MILAGSNASISFVTRRETSAYHENCCGADCRFDALMRRQLELHALFQAAPARARILVVRRDWAATVGMGNRMRNDAMALVLAMHLDRALLFAECAYEGHAAKRGLPNCSTPHLDYSNVMGLPAEIATATFGPREAAALAAAGQVERYAGAEGCDRLHPALGTRVASRGARDRKSALVLCHRRRLLSLLKMNTTWLTISHYQNNVPSLSERIIRSDRAAACIKKCARFVTLQPRGAALALLRETTGLAVRIDSATRIGAIHVRTGTADSSNSACASISTEQGLAAVDACFRSRRIAGRTISGRIGNIRHCRTQPLFAALPLSRMAAAIKKTCDAALFVSDHAVVSGLLNAAQVTPEHMSLAALIPGALKGSDSVTGHSSRLTTRSTFARLTLRAAVEFYLLSMAHVFVQTTASAFTHLAHERGQFYGQDFVQLHVRGGAKQLCRALGADVLGRTECEQCADA